MNKKRLSYIISHYQSVLHLAAFDREDTYQMTPIDQAVFAGEYEAYKMMMELKR